MVLIEGEQRQKRRYEDVQEGWKGRERRDKTRRRSKRERREWEEERARKGVVTATIGAKQPSSKGYLFLSASLSSFVSDILPHPQPSRALNHPL